MRTCRFVGLGWIVAYAKIYRLLLSYLILTGRTANGTVPAIPHIAAFDTCALRSGHVTLFVNNIAAWSGDDKIIGTTLLYTVQFCISVVIIVKEYLLPSHSKPHLTSSPHS